MMKFSGIAIALGSLLVAGAGSASAGHCGMPRYHYSGPTYYYGPSTYQSPSTVYRQAQPYGAPSAIVQTPSGQTYRSFSYEPDGTAPSATPAPAAPAPVYQAPAYQAPAPAYRAPSGGGGGSRPTYLLPKTDSRRFSGR